MKHIGRVSKKALPAPAVYQVPRNLFDIMSWTDIIVVIGLTLEVFWGWLFGGFVIPNDLRG